MERRNGLGRWGSAKIMAFTNENGALTSKNGALTIKNDGLSNKNGSLSNKNGVFYHTNWEYNQQIWFELGDWIRKTWRLKPPNHGANGIQLGKWGEWGGVNPHHQP